MSRLICLAVIACCGIGCIEANPTSPATISNPPESTSKTAFPIDYAQWPQLTDGNVKMPASEARLCAAIMARPTAASFGPHLRDNNQHSVRYFINPTSEAAFHKNVVPMPVGTTIVKEKWKSQKENERGTLTAIAAMMKREPGYAKEHGDWEYIYAERTESGNQMKMTRGQIATCVECHTREWEKDYLFYSSEMLLHGVRPK